MSAVESGTGARGGTGWHDMSRPDQSITFLKRFGYSVFRVPRLSAQPLELLHRNGKDLTRLGSVTDLITAGQSRRRRCTATIGRAWTSKAPRAARSTSASA